MKLTRIINGVIALGLATAVATVSSLLPDFEVTVGSAPVPIEQQAKPKNLAVVCPGSLYLLGGSTGTQVNQLKQVGQASYLYSADTSAGLRFGYSEIHNSIRFTSGEGSSERTSGDFKTSLPMQFVIADPTGRVKQSAALVSASQVQSISADNVNGLSATACTTPKSEQWIIGAEAITGRDGVLILVNNASIDSTVSLQIYTDAGLISAGGLNGISVPKASAVAIPIATLAPKAPTSAIKITASGASVAAWVQQKTVRATLAAGVDYIPAAIDAAKSLVIPGLSLKGTESSSFLSKSNDDYFDVEPSVDVFVPGDKNATVTVQVLGAGNLGVGTVINQTVSAGRLARLPIEGLGDGDYTLFIESDVAVQAVARFSRSNRKLTPNTDFAYLPAVTQSKLTRSIAVPFGYNSKLTIANFGDKDAKVALTNLETKAQETLTLGALSSRVVKLNAGKSYQLDSDAKTAATLVIDSGVQISALALEPYQNLAKKIAVSVR